MSQTLGVLFAIVFVLVFITLISLSIRRERKRIAEKSALLSSMGYQVLDRPDPAFVERVRSLRTRWGRERYQVRFCAVRDSWEYSSYVFDLWKRSGKNTRLSGENSMAFVSSKHAMPRFSLMPQIEVPGMLSGLLETLTTKLLSQWGGRVEFPENPTFAERCLVAGADHDAIRRVLSGPVMDYLLSHNRFHIEAENDMVMVTEADFERRKASRQTRDLNETVSEATALYELLMEQKR